MILQNKLNITNQIELAKAEEKISKQKAKLLYDSHDIENIEVGTFSGLCFIHSYLVRPYSQKRDKVCYRLE